MPHISIKLYPGRAEDQKHWLAREIVKDVVSVTGCEEKVVSVSIEEVTPEDWPEKVYRPEIIDRQKLLYVAPGYNPFE